MPAGRPNEYTEDILVKAQEYLDLCIDEEDEFHKTRGVKSDGYERLVRVRIPTIEGLAVHLNIARSTLYEWKEKYKELADIIDNLQDIQADRLLNNGLSGDYNPTIAKVLLTKHGYREAVDTDMTSGGKPITINIAQEIADKNNLS